MRNTTKFNAKQLRNLFSSRPETSLSSTAFQQKLYPQLPNFSSTITFRNKTVPSKPINSFTCSTTFRHLTTTNDLVINVIHVNIPSRTRSDVWLEPSNPNPNPNANLKIQDGAVEEEDVEPIDAWEEEDEAEPEIGDGGDGGGVVLQNCSWGERALSLANEVLCQYGDDIELFGFKTSPRGYVYVRIDKLSTEYGCPSMELIEDFSCQYKQKLDEAGESRELPDDLALEVSSPGAERLLKVPDDLLRFKHMPMTVNYTDDSENNSQVKIAVLYLESIDMETGSCIWKLADVKENRDPSAKGRPLSRKLKDWRLELPFTSCKKAMLYLG